MTQGFFTGGLYVFLGIVGLIFFGKDYILEGHMHTLDLSLSAVMILVGIGFVIDTWVAMKKEGKSSVPEPRGCFLPDSKK